MMLHRKRIKIGDMLEKTVIYAEAMMVIQQKWPSNNKGIAVLASLPDLTNGSMLCRRLYLYGQLIMILLKHYKL